MLQLLILRSAPRRSSDLVAREKIGSKHPTFRTLVISSLVDLWLATYMLRKAPNGIVVHDLELQCVRRFLSRANMTTDHKSTWIFETLDSGYAAENGAMQGISHSNFQVGSNLEDQLTRSKSRFLFRACSATAQCEDCSCTSILSSFASKVCLQFFPRSLVTAIFVEFAPL